MASDSFNESVENSAATLPVVFDRKKEELIQQNREILSCVVDAITFCGKQCIALRGDSERLDQPGNPGNFLAILQLMSKDNAVLQEHLRAPTHNNAIYISPNIQNQIIEIIGKDVIQASIIEEIRKAGPYSVMADEVTSHNKEQLSICLRFVDGELNVREEFVAFQHVIRTSGEAIASALLKMLETFGLRLDNLRGQGYDGAAAMSSDNVGVQARIRKEAPLAFYTHCSSHCLNLVLAHLCQLPAVRNMLDKLKETSLFFNSSPKREALLVNIINTLCVPHDIGCRKPLLDLCKTRWAERQEAYRHFYQSYCYVIKCLEVIAFGLHADQGFDPNLAQNGNWSRDSVSRASSLLSALCDFSFIVTFVTVYKVLSRLEGITVLLQGVANDIVSAMEMVEDVKEEYKEIRIDIDTYFEATFTHAVRLAASVGTDPSFPRIAKRQTQRANAESSTVQQYFLRNVAIPFLDHVISELDTQFSESSSRASKLLHLVPSVISTKQTTFDDIKDSVDVYREDLPCPSVMAEEYRGWCRKFRSSNDPDLPRTCADAIKVCNESQFPNIFALLKIACVVPVTSCSCERSFSAIRRLNNYMRCTMGQERLCSLALMHIHYDLNIDTRRVVDMFARKHPRRFMFESLLDGKD